VFERSEFSSAPTKSIYFWESGDKGALFFGSVSFGHAKEMNAQRQRRLLIKKTDYKNNYLK